MLDLRRSLCGRSGVEAGPEHPEEDGSDHGEEVGGVSRALFLVVLCGVGVEHPGGGHAEVGAEQVDEDGVPGVDCAKELPADNLVDDEEDDLDQGHGDQLQRRGGSQDDTEGDQDRGGGEVSQEHPGEEEERRKGGGGGNCFFMSLRVLEVRVYLPMLHVEEPDDERGPL